MSLNINFEIDGYSVEKSNELFDNIGNYNRSGICMIRSQDIKNYECYIELPFSKLYSIHKKFAKEMGDVYDIYVENNILQTFQKLCKKLKPTTIIKLDIG